MPAPTPAALSETAKRNFSGLGIRLPVDWQDMGPLYPQAFSEPERDTHGNAPTDLFHEQTRNRYHTQASRTVGRGFERYIEGVCEAISDAIGKWMRTASVVSVTINGPVGTLLPGGVTGPLLKPLILARAPMKTGMEEKYSNAIAEAVGNAWFQWQRGLSGMLSYPSFAAAPMPVAPPTPNVPASLVTFGSSGETALAPANLKSAMKDALKEDGQHSGALFDSVAKAFYTHFQSFKTTTLMTGVIGTGPVSVPPSGPVTGGMVIPSPGNFA